MRLTANSSNAPTKTSKKADKPQNSKENSKNIILTAKLVLS